eukprot:CFRG2493T1
MAEMDQAGLVTATIRNGAGDIIRTHGSKIDIQAGGDNSKDELRALASSLEIAQTTLNSMLTDIINAQGEEASQTKRQQSESDTKVGADKKAREE